MSSKQLEHFSVYLYIQMYQSLHAACIISVIHCVQKKTPNHIFFHISKSGV